MSTCGATHPHLPSESACREPAGHTGQHMAHDSQGRPEYVWTAGDVWDWAPDPSPSPAADEGLRDALAEAWAQHRVFSNAMGLRCRCGWEQLYERVGEWSSDDAAAAYRLHVAEAQLPTARAAMDRRAAEELRAAAEIVARTPGIKHQARAVSALREHADALDGAP